MEQGWEMVRAFNKAYHAEIAKEVLEDNGITAVILNKQDGSYMTFGDVEVYVKEEHLEQAKKLLVELK